MTREEQLACLEDRPCSVCKFHTDRCNRWTCVFEDEPEEQEPCEDCITLRLEKGALKYSNKDYVVYKKEWLKKWWQPELALLGIELPSIQPTAKENLAVEDCISRQAVLNEMEIRRANGDMITAGFIKGLPSIQPKSKTGQWLRMSALSEQEDDRYKCSHCGNVIHYKDKMNLYTFNRWCGRCGSDNDRK